MPSAADTGSNVPGGRCCDKRSVIVVSRASGASLAFPHADIFILQCSRGPTPARVALGRRSAALPSGLRATGEAILAFPHADIFMWSIFLCSITIP
jgi:hypothetical protein